MSGAVAVAITKRLPGFTLDVSWAAEQSVLGLFGPSGAGKTLTLQCLAGLIRPDAGRIVVGERVFFDAAANVDLSPQQRRIGYVFQGYALFPHLTVVKNIAFGLRGRPRGDRARRTAQVIERRTGATLSARALRRPAPVCGAGPGARDRPGAPAAR